MRLLHDGRVKRLEALVALLMGRRGGGGGTFARTDLPYTTIYVDPQDETGNASNTNPGTSPSLPIATTAHLNAVNFFGNLTANTTIEYLSEDTSGTGFQISTLDLGPFSLTINMERVSVHAGGTLDAGTVAIDPEGNQAQIVHTSDIATFAPYVVTQLGGAATYPVMVLDTTTLASAFVVSDAAPAAPKCSRALLEDGTIGALTIGDGYTLTRGGQLTLSMQPAPLYANVAGSSITFNDVAFTANSGGIYGASPLANRCSFMNVNTSWTMTGCFCQAGTFEVVAGPLSMVGGVLVTTGDDTWSGSFELGGDVYVTGRGFQIGGDFFANVFFIAPDHAEGEGVQFQDNQDNGLIVYNASSLVIGAGATQSLFWGTGNVQAGLVVFAGQSAAVASNRPPIVTGLVSDFAFFGPAGADYVMVARAAVLGEYSEAGAPATRATTWSNFAATVGAGGFGFQAHDVESNSALVGI
jgi:hypothetical protein